MEGGFNRLFYGLPVESTSSTHLYGIFGKNLL